MKRFKDRVVIVAGADTKIGRATATSLAGEGGIVALAGYDSGKLEELVALVERLGGKATATSGKPFEPALAKHCVDETLEAFGRVDALVNAWEFPSDSDLEATGEDEWDLTIDASVKVAFNFTKFASAAMIKGGGGRIVNITARELLGREGATALSAAAAAIGSLTRTSAVELGKFQVNVNAVAVGEIDWNAGDGNEPRELPKSTPLRRAGSPDELAQAILFLASGAASYITGQILFVSGGQELVPALVLTPSSLPAQGISS